jgi:hypothetical protein
MARPQMVTTMVHSASGDRKLWSPEARASGRKHPGIGCPLWKANSGDGRRVHICQDISLMSGRFVEPVNMRIIRNRVR